MVSGGDRQVVPAPKKSFQSFRKTIKIQCIIKYAAETKDTGNLSGSPFLSLPTLDISDHHATFSASQFSFYPDRFASYGRILRQ